MKIVSKVKQVVKAMISRAVLKFSPVRWKNFHEINYWKQRKVEEGILSNSHYKKFYTSHFGLDESFYNEKTILDIGCGPRGSLEWATMALRRIGLDPLAKDYSLLGANLHEMEYICSPSEHIPMKDGECDAVFSFNSLDHVDDVEQTVKEIKRVTKSGGVFLLLVEVNSPPTDCEPHELTPQKIIALLKPEFKRENIQVYESAHNGMYLSIEENVKRLNPEDTEEIGYMSAKFVRMSSG